MTPETSRLMGRFMPYLDDDLDTRLEIIRGMLAGTIETLADLPAPVRRLILERRVALELTMAQVRELSIGLE